jgi:TonB family protein
MKRGQMVWLCGWLLAVTAGAAGAQDVRKTAEAGMVVTGTVEVNPDGTLHGYVLDRPEKLPPVVVEAVGRDVPRWKFTLSGPTAAAVKTTMSLRVVAKPAGDGNFRVGIAGASFGPLDSDGAGVTGKDRTAMPHYPPQAIKARVSGTAYLALRVGRDGTVQEAIAEQVNLDQFAAEAAMDRYRKDLADASLEAARKWTFNPPAQGPDANNPYWVVRVPVSFSLHRMGDPIAPPYGRWDVYLPGPRQTAPWIGKALANQSPDAMPDGVLRSGNTGLQLATPLDGV